MESSKSYSSSFYPEGSNCRKVLPANARIIGGTSHYSATPPTEYPTKDGDGSCFFKIDLLRKCFVGGHGEQQHNLCQTPTGQPIHSGLLLSATPLHDENMGDVLTSGPSSTALTQSAMVTPTMSLSSNYIIRRSPPTALFLHGLHRNSEQRWEELEDVLLPLLNGRFDRLAIFKNLHTDGIQNSFLLQSIAYLSTFRKGNCERDESAYYECISAVASYLSVGRAIRERKLAVVNTLMTCLSPPEASWQVKDSVVEGTLDFITCRSGDEWEFMEHTETMLVWELRAMSLCLLIREQERVALVAKTGDTAAIVISAGARLVEEGMNRSAKALSSQIEQAGMHVKEHLKADDYPLIMDRDAVIALTFADAAKRASLGARESTKLAIDSIRDASSRGMKMVARKLEDGKLGENLPPEGREALKAAGKVGLATVGAAAIVGEAFWETGRLVMEKTGIVASDVVGHKFGSSAGQVASDVNETAANILRTIGNVANFSETSSLAITVATGEAKDHAIREAEKPEEAIKRLEAQASSLFKNAITNGGRWMSPVQIAVPPRAPPVQSLPIRTESVSGTAKCLFSDGTKPESVTPDLAPITSKDSVESSPTTSIGRTSSSDEGNSLSLSKAIHSSPSTTTVTIAIRRRSASHRSLNGLPASYSTPRRKPNLRSSTSKRRGTGKRVPITPDVSKNDML